MKLSEGPSRAGSLALIAGELALDFSNTTSDKGGPQQNEHLREPAHVVIWAQHAKVLAPHDCEAALERVTADPELGHRLLAEALELREAIFCIGRALAEHRPPEEAHSKLLAAVHARSLAAARLTPHGDGYVWSWDPRKGVIEAILGPIAFSALTMLTQHDLSRIKQCEGDHCGWLFFDTTKNKRRRWCEMSVCGNRAKIRALRERRKTDPEKIKPPAAHSHPKPKKRSGS
jgi:predicted RNA-binding Zn ribbon-like protein